jgi:hypothetical protein
VAFVADGMSVGDSAGQPGFRCGHRAFEGLATRQLDGDGGG